jgi:hypothetical protein
MGRMLLVDVPSGVTLCSWSLPVPVQKPLKGALNSDYGIYAAAVNKDGDMAAVSVISQLQFFSLRSNPPTLLGSYDEAHTEAVTQLTFHPALPGHIASGGDDGLLCFFDTSVKGEEEALVTVCNAESAVAHFGFFGASGELAWVCTRTLTLSLWNLESALQIARFDTLVHAFLEAGLFVSELLGCRYIEGRGALELLSCSGEGTIYVWAVLPPAASSAACVAGGMPALEGIAAFVPGDATALATANPAAAGAGAGVGADSGYSAGPSRASAGFTVIPAYQLDGVHDACARTVDWATLRQPTAGAAGAGAGAGGGVGDAPLGHACFTAGEDGTLVQWVDAAGAELAGAVGGGGLAAAMAAAGSHRSSAIRWRGGAQEFSAAALATSVGAGSASGAAAFASRHVSRPVSPPATNGSGTAAAAFLFGADNAGDGSAIDAEAGSAMQAATDRAMAEDGPDGVLHLSDTARAAAELRRARGMARLNPFGGGGGGRAGRGGAADPNDGPLH